MCRTYGPKAPQGETLAYRDLSSDYDFAFQFVYEPMDEKECLVLNVWTKGINDGKKRPVFVWFHGGGFSSGSGHDLPCYEGRALAAKGDVVVVNLNHRLNVLGYTDLRGLGGRYAESVNLGQQDLVKALEWVHKNIAAFGGDPANVTIGGQSGGGGKVSNVLAMPSARGLFQKAIVQSGSNMPYAENEASKAFGLAFAKELGVTPGHTEKLDSFTYEELVAASRRAAAGNSGVGFGGALPVLDGKYITEIPVAPEQSRDIPMLVGTNLYEFSYAQAKPGATLEEIRGKLIDRFDGSEDKANQFIVDYKHAYPGFEPRDLLNTDFFFRPGAAAQVKAKSAQGAAPVYSFLFTWKPEGSDIGACHGMELPFMFNNIALQPEMTLLNAWALFCIESAPVILHGEEESFPIKAARHLDVLCVAMPDGVLDEFAYDPKKGMCRVVREAYAWDVEAYDEIDAVYERCEGASHGIVHVCLLKGEVAQVPDAVAKFVSAGLERAGGDVEMIKGRTLSAVR